MVKKLENKKWIKVRLGMGSASTGLIKNKKLMKEYADELGWKVTTYKEGIVNEDGIRIYFIRAIPNKQMLLSPEEFRKLKNKLTGFAYELHLDFEGENADFLRYESPLTNIMSIKKPQDLIIQQAWGNILIIEYPITKAIQLEKEDPNLAEYLFERQVEDHFEIYVTDTGFIQRLIRDKSSIKARHKLKKRIADFYGIELD